MSRRILVTGGAGFIGSNLVDALLDDGHDVAVVDNLSTGRRHLVNPRARFYHLDITSPQLEDVFARERPQVVSHHAAQVSVQHSMTDPQDDARTNILGSLHLFKLCQSYGVQKVVYASTGGALYGEPRYLPCDENHPIQPLSPYGASKYAVELYLHIYRQSWGLDYTILRYGNVYGPRQDPYGEAGVVAIFADRMVQGKPCLIYGSGEQERDFVYVEDVVQANLHALERGSGEAYNIGTGQGASVNAIFQGLARALGYQEPPQHTEPRPGEVFKISLSHQKATRELGWQPRVSLMQGLQMTAEYFRRLAEERPDAVP